MSEESKCPNCGAKVNIDTNGIMLIGIKDVECPSCKMMLTATVSLSFGDE